MSTVPSRTIEDLPPLVAALAPKLLPLVITFDGPRMRIAHPPLETTGMVAVLAALGAVLAAALGAAIAWIAGGPVGRVTAIVAVAGFAIAFVIGKLLLRAWTVEIDRVTRAVRRQGWASFADTCGPSDVVVLRPSGASSLDKATGRYLKVALHVSLDQPDGDRRPLFDLVRPDGETVNAQRVAVALAAWLGIGFLEHPLELPAPEPVAPERPSPPPRKSSGKSPGETALNDLRNRLGQGPIPKPSLGDAIKDIGDLLDLLT